MVDLANLRDPVVIAAFEGWNDAAEAATGAVDHLVDEWDAELSAHGEIRRFTLHRITSVELIEPADQPDQPPNPN